MEGGRSSVLDSIGSIKFGVEGDTCELKSLDKVLKSSLGERNWFVYVLEFGESGHIFHCTSKLGGVIRLVEVNNKRSVDGCRFYAVARCRNRSEAEQYKIYLTALERDTFDSKSELFLHYLRQLSSVVAEEWEEFVRKEVSTLKKKIEDGASNRKERLLYSKLSSQLGSKCSSSRDG